MLFKITLSVCVCVCMCVCVCVCMWTIGFLTVLYVHFDWLDYGVPVH